MQKLRVASCQFPVTDDIERNSTYLQRYLRRAAQEGADLLHTSEACLSGYAGYDYSTFDGYDWDALRRETKKLRELSASLGLWLVLGSSHYLDNRTKPTNCVYLIDRAGTIVDRYDKRMCTPGDQLHYSAGMRFVTTTINKVKLGLAICYDICYPQIYMAYREMGVKLMLHSFYNARDPGRSWLDVLNVRKVPTRCADNGMWAVANNSSHPYSHWASFVARPDATIPKRLKINQAGMLIHEFPDGLSEGGWIHNLMPAKLAVDELFTLGNYSRHPRQLDSCAEP